jgi:CheY-like chemotaxis protein
MGENPQPSHPPEGTTAKAAGAIGPVRTLIVDDSAFGLKTLAQILAMEGNFEVVGTAADGRQAVQLAVSLKPRLVLMDYHMSNLNGIEAMRYMKQLPDPPTVIIVTSDSSPHSQALAKSAGADGFADKGGDLHSQLHLLLSKFLDSRREALPAGQAQNFPNG